MKNTILVSLTLCATAVAASAATLAHRYSYDADASDSVGGNDGVLVGGVSVGGGQLNLAPTVTGPDADSMGFTNPVDLATNFSGNGVTFESWYTDNNSGSWAKLFSFGQALSGNNLPNLTYMLVYEDDTHHKSAWDAFRKAPAWTALKAEEQYADTVSKIVSKFMVALSYSGIR